MGRAGTVLSGLVCLGLSAASGYWWLQSRSATASANLTGVVVEPAEHDFGAVEQGPTLYTQFTVTNHGPGEVTLGEPMKSCACASAELDRRYLRPGESATLTVGWRTAGKVGRSRETVAIQHSGPATANQPVITLATVAGTISPPPTLGSKE